VLSNEFRQIRNKYGFFDSIFEILPKAHTNKKKDIPLIRKLIGADATLPEKTNESIGEMMLRLTGIDITCCPVCKKGKMIRIRKLPNYYLNSS
jgi:hypothetical protein